MANQMDARDLKVDQIVTVASTESFRSTIKRVSPGCFEVNYYDQPTNDEVLTARFSMNGHVETVWFDQAYWTTIINGRRATEFDIQELHTKSGWGFRADPDAGELTIKWP